MDPATPFLVGLIIFALSFFIFMICAWFAKVCWGTRCSLVFAFASYLLSFMYLLGYFEVGIMDRGDGFFIFIPRFLVYSIVFSTVAWCIGEFMRHTNWWKISLMYLFVFFNLFLFAGSFTVTSAGRWAAFAYALAGFIAILYILWARRARRDKYSNILGGAVTLLLLGYFVVWAISAGTVSITLSTETWLYLILDVFYFVVFGCFIVRYMGFNIKCPPKCCNICKKNPCCCQQQHYGGAMHVQQHAY